MPISRTSIWAAAARAFSAREPDAHVRNPDWLAERFLGPEERQLLANHPLITALDQQYQEATHSMEVVGSARLLIARTRFIDDRFEAALRDGTRQFVILGAGFDTRAYRFADRLREAHVIEVDQPEMQQLKAKRIKEVVGGIPDHVTLAPIDFTTMKLGDVLSNAGFKPDQQALFIWEGVTMYLPEDSIKEVLRWIAGHTRSGSSTVFDYTYSSTIQFFKSIDMNQLSEVAKQAVQRFRNLTAGEPWIFGLPDQNEKAFMNDLGFDIRDILGVNSAEAIQKYLTRADGSIFGVMPATDRQWYLILEAAVL
jgi:methyltransferase (TIGR00027 family)